MFTNINLIFLQDVSLKHDKKQTEKVTLALYLSTTPQAHVIGSHILSQSL